MLRRAICRGARISFGAEAGYRIYWLWRGSVSRNRHASETAGQAVCASTITRSRPRLYRRVKLSMSALRRGASYRWRCVRYELAHGARSSRHSKPARRWIRQKFSIHGCVHGPSRSWAARVRTRTILLGLAATSSGIGRCVARKDRAHLKTPNISEWPCGAFERIVHRRGQAASSWRPRWPAYATLGGISSPEGPDRVTTLPPDGRRARATRNRERGGAWRFSFGVAECVAVVEASITPSEEQQLRQRSDGNDVPAQATLNG